MSISDQEFDDAQRILSTLTTFHDEEDVRQLARAIREQRRLAAAATLREASEAYMQVSTMYVKGWLLDRADLVEGEA